MKPMVEVDRVVKKFGDFTAVNDLSFTVEENEIFGLLGPNGAGKTTTINMICGLLSPSVGSIRFPKNGNKFQKYGIGFCSQENILYPRLTCFEQLVFTGNMFGIPVKQARRNALKLLADLGLSDKTNAMAYGLSGGMKRRLNICLALIHDPELLILDEPEAGLDPQSRILVRDYIRNMGNQKTVILTTHNMDEADRLADRIAIMDYGKLLKLDTPSKLKATVGSGNLLELFLKGSPEAILAFKNKPEIVPRLVNPESSEILLRHEDFTEVFTLVNALTADCGITISEFRLRENTLEDVFIQLTGRTLRQ
ncbi:MAG TPA: ABC transporter ATP-binding protein [Bacteroidales bacterium]|nr:ABC transporter ATP-binding protein [Bacteroidales bacterium]